MSSEIQYAQGESVLCVRKTSDYFGQTGEVQTVKATSKGLSYAVRWSDGHVALYLPVSLQKATIPEKSFQVSNSGFRSGKCKTAHRVPPSLRKPLV